MKGVACVFLLAGAIVAVTGGRAAAGRFVVEQVANPEYRANELFPAFESYHSPRIALLREKYGLDKVVAGESDEWRRMLLLRHWIRTHMGIDNENPTRCDEEAFAILEAAFAGGRFHCGHFSIVQDAVLNSFGYVTRRLGCGPGRIDNGGHHGVNEVWVNSLAKWVVIDAKYDLHFEKDGVPLSALEIRDEVWKDGAKSVVRCFGLESVPDSDEYPEDFGPTRETYRWCSWETSTNRFTAWPAALSSTMIMLEDDIFRNNVWYRDGKPQWSYNTPYLITTTQRKWIEWTPNTIHSEVTIDGETARLELTSFTPNFRTYQVKTGNGPWIDCGMHVTLPLKRAGNAFTFRAVNLFGVTGPEHRVVINWHEED